MKLDLKDGNFPSSIFPEKNLPNLSITEPDTSNTLESQTLGDNQMRSVPPKYSKSALFFQKDI